MPRDPDGTYNMPVNSANPAVPLTAIDSTAFNSIMDDIEAALAYLPGAGIGISDGAFAIDYDEMMAHSPAFGGRSLNEKLGDVIDLRDYSSYGAAADYDFALAAAGTDFGSDNTPALTQAFLDASSGDVIHLGPGVRRFATQPVTTKRVGLVGTGRSESVMVCDLHGPKFNLAGSLDNQKTMYFANFSLATPNLGLHTGLEIIGKSNLGGNAIRVTMDNIGWWGCDRLGDVVYAGNPDKYKCEWQTGLKLSETRALIRNATIFGKSSGFADGWNTNTRFLYADSCTGTVLEYCRGQNIKEFVEIVGQCEGLHLADCAPVSVNRGIWAHNLVQPSNDISAFNTHIAAFSVCVTIETLIEPLGARADHCNYYNCDFLTRTETPALVGFKFLDIATSNAHIVNNVFNYTVTTVPEADAGTAISLNGIDNHVRGNTFLGGGTFYKRSDTVTKRTRISDNIIRTGTGGAVPKLTDTISLQDSWGQNFLDGADGVRLSTASATTTTIMTLPIEASTALLLTVYVWAVQTNGTHRGTMVKMATVYRVGAAAAAIEGAVTTVHKTGSNPTWDVTLAASANDILVQVVSTASPTNWIAKVDYRVVSQTGAGLLLRELLENRAVALPA